MESMRLISRVLRARTALLTLAVVLAFWALGIAGAGTTEHAIFSARLEVARWLSPPKVSGELALVLFDDTAMEGVRDGRWAPLYAPNIGRKEAGSDFQANVWPWPRFIHGQMVRELAAQGAAAISFDIIFAEPQSRGRTELIPARHPVSRPAPRIIEFSGTVQYSNRGGSNWLVFDRSVSLEPHMRIRTGLRSSALLQLENTILRLNQLTTIEIPAKIPETMLTPDEFFAEQVRLAGNVILARSRETVPYLAFATNALLIAEDEVVWDRGVPTIRAFKREQPAGKVVWNLGFATAAQSLGLDLENAEIRRDRIVLRGTNGMVRIIPTDAVGTLRLNWAVRWADVAAGRSDIQRGHLGSILAADAMRVSGGGVSADEFRGKAVLVGAAATNSSMADFLSTPVEDRVPALMLHLNTANALLTEGFVRDLSRRWQLILIAGMGLVAASLVGRVGLIRLSGLVLLIVGGYVCVAFLVFAYFQLMLPVTLPVGCALAVSYLGILLDRTDPLALPRRFFASAGFSRFQTTSTGMLRLPERGDASECLVVPWRENSERLLGKVRDALKGRRGNSKERPRLYLVYRELAPSSEVARTWREALGCDVIPLAERALSKSLALGTAATELRHMEEPYLVRADPYAEFKPISDPTWFYGREDLLSRLPGALAQGQHVGIFGLRKVGKTSLTNQLRQRFVSTPTAFLDCQGLPPKAEVYLNAIYREWHQALSAQSRKIRRAPGQVNGAESFRENVLSLAREWRALGHREPFIVFLDEIDRFLPNAGFPGRDEILAEYVKLFRVLRALAQSERCLVICVIAYRPNVNRQNLLTASAGENPMFSSFQEVYLGFLRPEESAAMVREIGLWKNIAWSEEAAAGVFQYCGGHPLITRHFASHACRKGTLKEIDLDRVQETAAELEKTLRKNEIGNYYKEAIGELLSPGEKEMLARIVRAGESGLAENEWPTDLEEALSNLENFGLVTNERGKLRIPAALFRAWLARRVAAEAPDSEA